MYLKRYMHAAKKYHFTIDTICWQNITRKSQETVFYNWIMLWNITCPSIQAVLPHALFQSIVSFQLQNCTCRMRTIYPWLGLDIKLNWNFLPTGRCWDRGGSRIFIGCGPPTEGSHIFPAEGAALWLQRVASWPHRADGTMTSESGTPISEGSTIFLGCNYTFRGCIMSKVL